MKSEFKLKISDLLDKPGKIDEVELENIFTDKIPWLDKDWISGILFLKSLNWESIFAELEWIKCKMKAICDHCNSEFEMEKTFENYTANFSLDLSSDERDDDTVFEIDGKNNIDVEDMIVQNIRLEDDLVHYCDKCEREIAWNEEDNWDEYEDNNLGWGNVVFR